jgi:hypothetical protein
MSDEANKVRRGRIQFLLLALLFIGPLAIAWVLYFGGGAWKPAGTTNHGILIEPPALLPEVRIAESGPDGSDGDLRGRWTMLYLDGGDCGDRCLAALDLSARVRLALGRRLARVQRAYIAEGPEPLPVPRDGSEILLVDPLGNLMMRFPLTEDPKGMLGDIKKLLRVSRIG